MHAYTHTHTHTRIHVHIHTHTCTLSHTHTHTVVQDGNMDVLEEELRNAKFTDFLEEPSYGPIPHTPLFTAFINDHYQVCMLQYENT